MTATLSSRSVRWRDDFEDPRNTAQAGGNAPVRLTGPDAWLVRRGHMDVFAIRLEAGHVAASRRHLFRVEAGMMLFPIERHAITDGAALLAVGGADTELTRCDVGNVLAATADAQDDAEPREWIGRWVQALAAVGAAEHPPNTDAISHGELLQMLERAHESAVRFAAESLQASANADADAIGRRAADGTEAYTGGWIRLSEVLPGRRSDVPAALPPSASPLEALVAASRIVGQAIGVDIQTPSALAMAIHARDPVAAIARSSRIRVRAVTLSEDWWRQDGGPLLGWLTEERRPVALIPISHRRYLCHDASTGEQRTVTADVAGRIASPAFVFYRSFGHEPLTLRRLFTFGVLRCRRDVMAFGAISLLMAMLSLLTPLATSAIFNDMIPSAERRQLIQLVSLLVVFSLAAAVLSAASWIAVLRIEAKLGGDLMAAVWDRLLALPASFFREYSAGNLAWRAMTIESIRQILFGATMVTLVTGTMSLFQLGFLFHVSAVLAALAAALVATTVVVTAACSYFQLKHQRVIATMQAKLSGLTLQLLSNISKLRVAGAERHAFNLWAQSFADQRQRQFKVRTLGNLLGAFNVSFPVVANVALFAVAVPVVTGSEGLRTGDFIAFLTAFSTMTVGMLTVSGTAMAMLGIIPLHEKLKPILTTTPEITVGQAEPGILRGGLDVQHLAFSYAKDSKPVLRDLSFYAAPGDFIALVGQSGTGKSTVLRLLLGFEKPDSGAVYYDGQDLANLDVSAVRGQLGVVLQGGQLMPGDIFGNIVGSSRATIDTAWEAARLAGLEEDIRNMPMGMQTVIGEGQSTLSGGQRQRLMIARALARRPRILFLDEATSALDNRTQASVSQSLDGLKVTRVVVAHRLSTIMHADRIYVMHDGQVIESGSYDELMRQNGSFADLAQRQLV
jgi:ATP-binding cassette subfamily C protein